MKRKFGKRNARSGLRRKFGKEGLLTICWRKGKKTRIEDVTMGARGPIIGPVCPLKIFSMNVME